MICLHPSQWIFSSRMAATEGVSCYPMNCLLLCTNTLPFGKLLWYLMMPNCLNSGLRYKAGWRTHGVPMVLHGDEVPVVGIGKIFFLIAPYLPMRWVVQWRTSSCIVGLSLTSFVYQVLHFFWVPWTLSSRSCSGPFRPCTWGFGQIQTGQGAGITTALLKVGMLELLWLEVMLVCCCNWVGA